MCGYRECSLLLGRHCSWAFSVDRVRKAVYVCTDAGDTRASRYYFFLCVENRDFTVISLVAHSPAWFSHRVSVTPLSSSERLFPLSLVVTLTSSVPLGVTGLPFLPHPLSLAQTPPFPTQLSAPRPTCPESPCWATSPYALPPHPACLGSNSHTSHISMWTPSPPCLGSDHLPWPP